MDITGNWIRSVNKAVLDYPSVAYAQERKFMEGVVIKVSGEDWAEGVSHSLPDLGYANSGSKMNQLKRNYYNQEAVEEARVILQTRAKQSVTSLGITTLGGAKKNIQGHCIRSITVNYFDAKVSPDKRSRLSIDILYRTTELLRKFGADLIFLHDFLIPEIIKDNPWDKEVDEVRFYFSSCFFSGLFIPVFYQFKDPVKFLETLFDRQGDSIFYRRCFFRTKTMLERDFSHYKFRSRRNMQELAQRFFDENKIDKRKLKKWMEEEE